MSCSAYLTAAAAAYQVACAFLKNDRLDDAETIAFITAANLDDDSPAGLPVRGALTLVAAVIAGRGNYRGEAADRLQRAQLLANSSARTPTTPGPPSARRTLPSIASRQRLSWETAAAAIAQAEFVDVGSLPEGLLSRRAQIYIDRRGHTRSGARTRRQWSVSWRPSASLADAALPVASATASPRPATPIPSSRRGGGARLARSRVRDDRAGISRDGVTQAACCNRPSRRLRATGSPGSLGPDVAGAVARL